MLPDYISKAVPNPADKRAPWYANTAPAYAGIFLWVAFYRSLADGTLNYGSLAVCLAGLVFAAILCYLLYYLAPAMLGMKTGVPLYVVGSSTFGTAGGYLMPGLLMGLLQIGWFAVATSIATRIRLEGDRSRCDARQRGIYRDRHCLGGRFRVGGREGHSVRRQGVATFLNFIPLLMLIVVFLQVSGRTPYQPPVARPTRSWRSRRW